MKYSIYKIFYGTYQEITAIHPSGDFPKKELIYKDLTFEDAQQKLTTLGFGFAIFTQK